MIEITLSLYVQVFIACLLGLLFHLLAVKIPSVKERARVANMKFSLLEYLKDDSLAIAASVVGILAYTYSLNEIIGYKPEIVGVIKFISIAVGFMGSSLFIAILGKASKAINAVVDVKTDELAEIKKSE